MQEKEIDYYLRYAAQGFGTKEHLDDYSKFFESVITFVTVVCLSSSFLANYNIIIELTRVFTSFGL